MSRLAKGYVYEVEIEIAEYENKFGGTGIIEFTKPVKARIGITNSFYDYETGMRYTGTLLDGRLKEFLLNADKVSDGRFCPIGEKCEIYLNTLTHRKAIKGEKYEN